MDIRGRFDLGPRVQVFFDESEGRTKQAMRDECDINFIMKKFIKTGAVDHGNKFSGDYGYATSVSFHDAMNLISKGESMFSELPAAIRDRFSNRVPDFLDFIQDPANAEEMVSLGLSEPGEPEAAPAAAAPATQEPPAGISEPEATSKAVET